MKTGDQVRVYPHGSPGKSAIGTISIVSANQRSIAVIFEDSPPFAVSGKVGVAILPGQGIVMLATRGELNGEPWGPWIEFFGRGHYEIEEAPASWASR